jgi:uncharacterized protein
MIVTRPRALFARAAILLVVAGLFAASVAFALDVPPTPTQWFTDKAGLVDASQAEALNQKLQAFEQKSGAQFIIYIFPSLENEALEDFTIRCAEKWKVGNKKYDNGVILFVFAKEKKIRIEVGYGLEPTLTDAFTSDVIRNEIAPNFKQGNYAGGLNAAADAITARISGKNAAVAPVHSPGSRAGGGRSTTFGCADAVIFAVIIIVFLLVIRALPRTGGCGGCFWPMMFLGGGGQTFGGGGGGWGGGGGFSGGGGSFGGGGASGGW